MNPVLEDIDSDANGSLGYMGKLLVAVWRREAPNMADRFRRAAERGAAKHKSGLMHFVIQEPGIGMLSHPTRAAIMKTVNEMENEFDGYATLVEGTGFVSAAFRAVVTGMIMMAPRLRSQIKVVGSFAEAERVFMGFSPNHRPRLTAASLEQAVATLRARTTPTTSA